MAANNKMPNKLINEKFSYLLQHAHNPVYDRTGQVSGKLLADRNLATVLDIETEQLWIRYIRMIIHFALLEAVILTFGNITGQVSGVNHTFASIYVLFNV